MENSTVINLILKEFSFLYEKFEFDLSKMEAHWLGGIIVDFTSNNKVISIKYDGREECFNETLYSTNHPNKTHLYLLAELREYCPLLPSPIVSIDHDALVNIYLNSVSICLEKNFSNIIERFERGNYFGGTI